MRKIQKLTLHGLLLFAFLAFGISLSAKASCLSDATNNTNCMTKFSLPSSDVKFSYMEAAGCDWCHHIEDLCSGTQTCAMVCANNWPLNYSDAPQGCRDEMQKFCGCPPPGPAPVVPVVPACKFMNWSQHQCGTAGFAPSKFPSALPSGSPTAFSQLMNPMVACCWNGWCQAGDPASCKMDCTQGVPGTDFLKFYNEGGPRAIPPVPAARADQDAGVLYPNRLFMVDRGVPVNGFYNSKGARCSYRDPVTKVAVPKTAPEQMAFFDEALDSGKPSTFVDPDCCSLMILAFERRCPTQNPKNGTRWTAFPGAGPYDSTVTRCTAAASMRTHFYMVDVCNPNVKKRALFHAVTSFQGADGKDKFKVDPINLQVIIQKTYPGACPGGFKDVGGGLCEIDSN